MGAQDQWWLTGLHRTVELHSVPEPCAIADYVVSAVPSEPGRGALTVRVSLTSPPAAGGCGWDTGRSCFGTHKLGRV